MHYIKFLKPPALAPPVKGSKDLQVSMKVAITSDLGESFLYVDLPITVTILDDKEKPIHSRSFLWKSGNRILDVSVSLVKRPEISRGRLVRPLTVLVHPQDANMRFEKLSQLLPNPEGTEPPALVVPILSEPLLELEPQEPAHHAQRVFKRVNGEPMSIWEETGDKSLARHMWDASLLLSAYLDQSVELGANAFPKPFSPLQKLLSKEKLNVLELGAGCGTVGLSLGRCLPKSTVMVTDLLDAEEIAKRNIWSNGIQPKPGHEEKARMQYKELDWEKPLAERYKAGDIDMILIVDCTYNSDVIPSLIKTMSELMRYNSSAAILLATKIRHDSELVFFDLIAKEGIAMEHKLVLPLPLLGRENEEIEVYWFARVGSQNR